MTGIFRKMYFVFYFTFIFLQGLPTLYPHSPVLHIVHSPCKYSLRQACCRVWPHYQKILEKSLHHKTDSLSLICVATASPLPRNQPVLFLCMLSICVFRHFQLPMNLTLILCSSILDSKQTPRNGRNKPCVLLQASFVLLITRYMMNDKQLKSITLSAPLRSRGG